MDMKVWLRRYRKKTGLSQQAFATACGISMSGLANYEGARGGRQPNLEAIIKFRHFAESRGDGDDVRFLKESILERLGFQI